MVERRGGWGLFCTDEPVVFVRMLCVLRTRDEILSTDGKQADEEG